ncbi:coproporphyrinogen dehydrogenase HemZ [Caloramator proteoclasticus]|uniref:Oxygen-independent coproporphyrinogen-3 oxidase n=1 Tax=Caloramator proteoclasticus DSM 10124 TaxID=1121262 RepID=A0A1M4WRN1_9CLOT|nr:coproporphyrinogen dehydrogenase HemZ [Caloramator proteoclasticus]SHE83885.1 oxygen-independent coproporphyrinogen-3 oxidase [Caloramator proteoclasticus DSM 10124]
MVRVGLIGHNFRYEVFQILNLFYEKEEIEFCQDGFEIESILDGEQVLFKIGEIIEKENIDGSDIKLIKNSLKRTALKALSRYFDKNIPWGILVGIRPTKIVHELKKRGDSLEEIKKHLMQYYLLNEDKANLTIEVAENEAKFLDKEKKQVSIYVGIPFCPTRCVYCSFASNSIYGNEKLVEAYVDSLLKEFDSILSYLKNNGITVDTLYFGGGTPSSLSLEQIDRLLDRLSNYVNLQQLREFTFEAGRPDSIDKNKLVLLKKYGVTRISINPQTMNEETLIKIGRRHSTKDIIDKFNLAREIGINNINMDIIVGLPDEDLGSINKTMEELKKLSPESITIHTMAIKRASILNEMDYKHRTDNVISMYNYATNCCREMGMIPYYMYRQKNMVSPLENVGYSKRGKECIYNIQMIAENISIISLGADAITKLVYDEENRIERVANVKDVKEYINRIDEMINKKIEAIDDILHK